MSIPVSGPRIAVVLSLVLSVGLSAALRSSLVTAQGEIVPCESRLAVAPIAGKPALPAAQAELTRILSPRGQLGGAMGGLALDGDRIFLGAGHSVLATSVTGGDRVATSYISDLLPGPVRGLVARDGILYVADGSAGLVLLDVSAGNRPRIIAAVDTAGSAEAVVLNGNRAYVADGDRGLAIVEIGQSDAPRVLAEVNTPGNAVAVALAGDMAYVADGPQGVAVVDLRNPTPRLVVGSAPSGMRADALAVTGQHLLVIDGPVGMRVLDASDPRDLVERATLRIEGVATGIVVDGATAYVQHSLPQVFQQDIVAVDVTQPAAPRVIGEGGFGGALERGFVVGPDRIWSAHAVFERIQIMCTERLTLSHCQEAPLIGVPIDTAYIGPPDAAGVASVATEYTGYIARVGADGTLSDMRPGLPGGQTGLVDPYAYSLRVGDYITETIMTVYSLADGMIGQPMRWMKTSVAYGDDTRLVRQGQLLWMTNNHTLAAFDTSRPQSPRSATPNYFRFSLDHLAADDRTLIATTGGTLVLLDTHKTSQIRIACFLELDPKPIRDVAIWNNLVAILSATGSITLLDVTNPLAVRRMADLPESGERLSLDGNYLYVASGQDLRAYDLVDPNVLTLTAATTLPSPIQAIQSGRGAVLVGTAEDGLWSLVLSVPADATPTPSLEPSATATPPIATASPTMQATADPSTTVTATPTRTYRPLYMPILLFAGGDSPDP